MSIWNKVLVGLIIAAGLGFWYSAMLSLKLHRQYRQQIATLEQQIKSADDAQKKAENGAEGEPGIRQLKLELNKYVAQRGRVWRKVTPQTTNPKTGEIRVSVEEPDPHKLEVKEVVYAFDDQPTTDGGRYLGQYAVSGVNDRQVVLTPVAALTDAQLKHLAESKGPWILMESLPIDRHDIYAGLSEEQLKQMLPEGSIADFIRQGQPATWEDVDRWGVKGLVVDEQGQPLLDDQGRPIAGAKGVFSRQLRDYGQALTSAYGEISALKDVLIGARTDIAQLQTSLTRAQEEIAARKQDVADMTKELADLREQAAAVANHQKKLEEQIAKLQTAVEQTIAVNRQYAEEIAKAQRQAAAAIDRRTQNTGSQATVGL